jgi:hypothetical protein
MDPFTMAAIMGATGMLTSHMQNKAQQKAQKANAESAAAQTRFSPYTKMGAGSFQAEAQKPVLNGAIQGATAGLNLSQAYDQSQAANKLTQAQTNYYNNAAPQPTSQPIMSNDYFKQENPFNTQPQSNPWAMNSRMAYGK